MKLNLQDITAYRTEGPWVMRHKWENLMCMHIPVDSKALSIYVPDPLDLDLYDSYAWLSIFTFNVRNMGMGNLPKFPYFHQFLELNVRTYVKYNNVPGVYFFSLDAAKFLPVSGGRLLTLPYFKARMKSIKKAGWTHFSSRRQPGNTPIYKLDTKQFPNLGFPRPALLITGFLNDTTYITQQAEPCSTSAFIICLGDRRRLPSSMTDMPSAPFCLES